jgi:hypothetical protein
MIRIIKWLTLAILLSTFCSAKANAQTINAASCASSAVQAALNSVAVDGTTVVIPAGSCAWSSSVSFTANFSITIQGQSVISGTCVPGGSCTAADNTVINESIASRPVSCGSGDAPTFRIGTVAGKSFRMTGITWVHTGNPTCLGTIEITGQSKQVRLDHNHISGTSFVAIGFFGGAYGVVDHNLFNPAGGTQNVLKFQADGWNNEGFPGAGDNSWNDATTFGSNRAWYIENNFFIVANGTQNHGSGYANDCIQGGRYVWRFNQIQNLMLQTHPTGGSGRHRGCRSQEIYGNAFTATGTGQSNMFAALWLSSGTALVWGNTQSPSGGWDQFVTLHSMRRNKNTYAQAATPSGWGYCGTSFSGTGSAWDQNTNTSTGRKCIDRPGMGKSDLLTGGFTSDGSGTNNVTNVTAGCGTAVPCWIHQQLEPVYEWLNTSPITGAFYWDVFDGELIGDQDYYTYTSSFNGTSGVGSGTLASRPTTCASNPDPAGIGGVAYWATDQGHWNNSGNGGQGVLYTCATTNTWVQYYTPLAYPHPLTVGSGTSPAPPTGLQAIVN